MRLRQIGGTVATIALVSVFVFGGVEVAHAAAPVTMTAFDSTGATNPGLVVHGTAEPGAPITVTATSAEATAAAYCQTTADGGGSWYCTKDTPGIHQVQFGSNVFTATDGMTSVPSAAITIYGTNSPSLTSPRAGLSILPKYPVFFGYGPARGSITVVANAGGPVCTVALVPDSGSWECDSAAVLPDGANGLTVMSSTPGLLSATSATVPVMVSQLTPPAMTYTMGYATGSATAQISFENGAVETHLYSITEPSGDGNGYLKSSNPEVSCGPVNTGPLVCGFGSLAPGIWQVNSSQYIGEMTAAERDDYFRIPAAPTMTATAQSDQTVAFSGTGTTGDLVNVTATGGSDGGTIVCTTTVIASAWNCTATATPGSHSYHASQLDQGWTPYQDNDSSGHVLGQPLGIVLDGRSALTTTATVIVAAPATPPAAPTMSYVMGYGTGSSTATGPEGALIHTELYSVTEPEGEGNGYTFGDPVLGCYPASEGPAGFVGAADVQPAVQSCDFGTLAPGIWNVYSGQNVNGVDSPYQNDFFRIPTAPSMVASGHADQTVSFSGTGTTGDLVSVIADGSATACSSTVVAGAWACTAAATPGSHSYQASQLDQGWTPYTDESGYVGNAPLGTVLNGRSALTAPSTVLVTAPVAPPVMSYDFGNASVTITATGDPAGDGASIEVYTVADGEGSSYSFNSYPACASFNGGGEGYYAEAASSSLPTTQTCTLSNLTPGIWNIFSSQSVNGEQSSYQNDYFRVPDAPTLSAQTSTPNTVTLSGTGTSGDIVTVLQDGAPACQATVAQGAWSCSISSTPGTHSYSASQLDQGFVITDPEETYGRVYNARSALSSSTVLAVAAPPASAPPASTPPVVTPPVVTPPTSTLQTLFFWVLNVVGGDTPLHAGDTVTVSSSGLPAGALVNFELHSTPRSLGSMIVGADGAFSRTLTIPGDVEPGDHHIVVTVTPQGEAPSPQEAAITIVQAPPAAASSSASGDSSKAGSTHSGSTHPGSRHADNQRNTLSAPSSFTNALPTLATVFENPGTLAVAVGLALAIMLLAALPTEILDSAVSSNLDRFGPFLTRAGSWAERATAWLNRVTHGPAVSSAVMIVLSSIIFGFADPGYGFNLVSLRLTLSIIVGLYVVYYIAPRISGALIKNRWGLTSEISIQPTALIFAIVGVIVGRLLGFSPGFLIGMAIGLELAANAKTLHKARSMAVQVGVIVGLALLAWVGYSLIALAIGGGGGSVWTGLVQDALSTITAEGLTGMLLGLFPLAFFEGKEVWDHSKLLWATLFLVTGTAFSLLVLPTAVAPQKIGESLPVWLLVLGCFTIVSLGVWLYLKLTTKPEVDTAETEPERVDA